MPRRPKKPCAHPGCPKLTDSRFCSEHKKEDDRIYNKYIRTKEEKARYGYAWRKIRARFIKSHAYCEECYREGRIVKAEHIHHIMPLDEGGGNEESNLMALCHSCHSRLHAKRGDRWNKSKKFVKK